MSINKSIYFDYSATTPVDPEVLDSMLPYFTQHFGNPSSIHFFGQKAESGLENSREIVAKYLNCRTSEVIFTSGGTESDNLALRGIAFAERKRRGANHILISAVEHPAVTKTALQLSQEYNFELEFLPVDNWGIVNPNIVKQRIRENTALVSVIYANNEIGTINPIQEIGIICKSNSIPFHTDAVQAGAFLDLNVENLNVDALSIGAHKFYGPKGVGVLYKRNGLELLSNQTGGSQEFGLRAGTQNIPYIVGLAKALQISQDTRQVFSKEILLCRDKLIADVLKIIPGSQLSGHPQNRLPNHSSFVFDQVNGNTLLMMLDIEGFACSSGSACKTGVPEPSDVLLALGIPPKTALGSLRITMGKYSTEQDIDKLLAILPMLVKKSRALTK